jgi:GntR family transcriptional regulator, galactonate operon transcriptional repressor
MPPPEPAEKSKPDLRRHESAHSVGVVERLVSSLAREIAAGVWKPNETLPIESELSQRFNAGRNAVREAVKILVAKGLLRTERRIGTIVRPETCWNLLDSDLLTWLLAASPDREVILNELSELRSMIEPAAASLAATHASAQEAMRIFEAYDEMEKHAAGPETDACIEFQNFLFEASRNRFLNALAPAFGLLAKENVEAVIRSGNQPNQNLKEHRQIAEAVSRRDADGARRATRKLLEKLATDLSDTQKRHRRKSEATNQQ